MDLIQMVMKQLGIDETQAKGGLGMIFDLAQSNLGKDDFQQVSKLVPGIDDMLKTAASARGSGKSGGGLMDMVGAVASKVLGGNLGNLTELVSGFQKLGLSADMVAKFVPIVLKFVEERGGGAVKDLLGKVLKA